MLTIKPMKYLSIDLEATGLEENAYIIEFAMVPFDAKTKEIRMDLAKQFFVKCPSFEELKPNLNSWVIDHNKELIEKAHKTGVDHAEFKTIMETYLESSEVKEFFGDEKVVLFGKSMSAIDLPFLNRDLGWEWMNKYFHHRNHDLSSFTLGLIDADLLPLGLDSGSKLMKHLGMGEVLHTALEDAVNTAKMYLKVLELIKK